ncbi:MAG: RNA polymerase sigma factor [Ruminococcaceae bacterium]|nr:RNA polymerase sigma factor [Oscillospiraceae bacterium]
MEFEGIYRTYFKAVYLYVLRLSGDEHIAEEITSEAFFKAIRSVDGFRGECEIRVWLCQIAKNTYYSYLKKHKRVQSIEEAELQEMADPYRAVFRWRVLAALSFKEIGGLYHKTDNWACVTYHRSEKTRKPSGWSTCSNQKAFTKYREKGFVSTR